MGSMYNGPPRSRIRVQPYLLLGRVSSEPLYNIDSRFERVTFDDSLESIRLIGTTFDYMYTIPTEILQLRGNV